MSIILADGVQNAGAGFVLLSVAQMRVNTPLGCAGTRLSSSRRVEKKCIEHFSSHLIWATGRGRVVALDEQICGVSRLPPNKNKSRKQENKLHSFSYYFHRSVNLFIYCLIDSYKSMSFDACKTIQCKLEFRKFYSLLYKVVVEYTMEYGVWSIYGVLNDAQTSTSK